MSKTLKINVTVERESEKGALLVTDGARRGWVMPRSYSNGQVNDSTFAKACAEFESRQSSRTFVREGYYRFADAIVLRETEKAVAVRVPVELCNLEVDREETMWLPKSQIRNGNEIPAWLISRKVEEMQAQFPHGSGAWIKIDEVMEAVQ